MKRIFSLIVLCVLLMTAISANATDRDITVIINGSIVETPVPARIINSRTVLPMRVAFEKLGAVVEWIPENRMIFATKDDSFIVMQIDNYNFSLQKASSNEKKIIPLDVAPFIDNGHTLIPLRAVAEALDAKVEWDPDTYTVNIVK